MVRLNMVPHRGVPVVAVHVSERDRRGSEPGYDEVGPHWLIGSEQSDARRHDNQRFNKHLELPLVELGKETCQARRAAVVGVNLLPAPPAS